MQNLKTVEKYYESLKALHSALKYTNKISISNWVKEHKISNTTGQFLQSGGILEKSSSNGITWKWKSPIPPNIDMAKELVRRINQHVENSKASSSKNQDKKEAKKSINVKVLQYSTISIMWGIIKIKINHYHK